MNNFISLPHPRFKILGIVISILAISLLVVLRILGFAYEEGWHDRIFIMNHFVIFFGLYMIMYSKELHDDERVQRIRYVLLKISYALTMCGILAYVSVTTLDRVRFSIYVVLYIAEAVLILYQIMFRFCLASNPSWIFKEGQEKNFRFYYLSFTLFFLLGWIVFVVIQYKI